MANPFIPWDPLFPSQTPGHCPPARRHAWMGLWTGAWMVIDDRPVLLRTDRPPVYGPRMRHLRDRPSRCPEPPCNAETNFARGRCRLVTEGARFYVPTSKIRPHGPHRADCRRGLSGILAIGLPARLPGDRLHLARSRVSPARGKRHTRVSALRVAVLSGALIRSTGRPHPVQPARRSPYQLRGDGRTSPGRRGVPGGGTRQRSRTGPSCPRLLPRRIMWPATPTDSPPFISRPGYRLSCSRSVCTCRRKSSSRLTSPASTSSAYWRAPAWISRADCWAC